MPSSASSLQAHSAPGPAAGAEFDAASQALASFCHKTEQNCLQGLDAPMMPRMVLGDPVQAPSSWANLWTLEERRFGVVEPTWGHSQSHQHGRKCFSQA